METIFDYNPTPEELRYLTDETADAYRGRVASDDALRALSILFSLRGDEERADWYANQISDKVFLRFTFNNYDLIPPSRAANTKSSALSASKAA